MTWLSQIRPLATVAALFLATAAFAAPADEPMLPGREWAMIRQIAANYDLSDEQTWLLAAIRCHENGRPGLEFGVGGRSFNSHVAHRYQDGFKSFYVQGSWAAGTIARHYNGNLDKFARRYCPEGPRVWATSVRALAAQLKNDHDGKLPGEAYPKRPVPFLRRGAEADETSEGADK